MKKILVIDDDELFLEVIREMLEVNSFQAIFTTNGRLGLQLAETEKPNLIICDIQMPGLSGYEVLMALRKNPVTCNIPFIILTSESTPENCIRAKELGASDCRDKFFEIEEFVQLTRTILKDR
jgi:two-component system, sensor histidine kinase and response regulator